MKESDNIDSFFTQVIGLVTQIRSHGEILKERRIVEKLLRVLPSKFDVIVTTIEETKDLTNFSVDELHASLITHEQRLSRNELISRSLEDQMSLREDQGKGKRERDKPNRGGRNSPANTQGRGNNPNQNQGQGNNQQSRQHHAQGQRLRLQYRMTGNIALFSKLDQSVKSQVTLETDSKVFDIGKGEVNILTKKGEKKTIADVYYVPGMKCNLLSIGKLVQKGYNVFFENDVCTIMDRKPNKLCIAEVKMTRNTMIPLRIKTVLKDGVEIAAVTQDAFQSEPKDENWLWHLRFGHFNFGGLNLLNRK
eukprot:PITA_20411